ncbi:hypothetical protein [Escherichia coli]|uniref:hypothetical protein n=1 Tax=Escherichia coli TaxID=562 RepID=UPI002032940D|nr:hypothetical protein [Escherichia coli]
MFFYKKPGRWPPILLNKMRLMAMAVDSGGEDGSLIMPYKFWRRCRRDGLGKRIYLFARQHPARKN